MLIDQIRSAQEGNESAMLFLIEKFSGLLKKYGRKLRYEDAENDLTVDFIELLKTYGFEKMNNSSDGAIVNFLARSVYRFYLKRLRTLIEKTPYEISIEDLTPAQKTLYPQKSQQKMRCQFLFCFSTPSLHQRKSMFWKQFMKRVAL